MAEINVNEAIVRISSEKAKDRAEGVADLRHIFSQNRRGLKLDALTDKGYHKIYEALFRISQQEKSVYLRADTNRRQNDSASRLSSYASALRLVVEFGLRRLKTKTVKALIDHIIQTLPLADGSYCEPLTLDYLKSLRSILEFQPHVEHLAKTEWFAVVEFCCQGIAALPAEDEDTPSHASRSTPYGTRSTHRQASVSRSLSIAPSREDGPQKNSRSTLEQLLLGLQQLACCSNAPVVDKAADLLSAIFSCMQSSPTAVVYHQAAFAAVNSILLKINTESIALTKYAVRSVIPLAKRLWTTKSSSLKDEILIALSVGDAYLHSLLREKNNEDLVSDVESLLETLLAEYSKRLERDQLQIDDLGLPTRRHISLENAPLHLTSCFLRNGRTRAEQNWMLLRTIARLSSCLDSIKTHADSAASASEIAYPHKRRRITFMHHELLRQSQSLQFSTRLCALQGILFLVEEREFEERELKEVLEELSSGIADENGTISSWTLMAITSCLCQKTARAESLQSQWLQIWQVTARSVASPSKCRLSCHLLSNLLALGLVDYGLIADLADTMISSIEVYGPTNLTDTSICFWIVLLEKRFLDTPNVGNASSERVLPWLFKRLAAGDFTERHFVAQMSQHFQPSNILNLLFLCSNRALHPLNDCISFSCGPIAQTSLHIRQYDSLIDYLLMLSSCGSPNRSGSAKSDPMPDLYQNGARFHIVDNLILEALISQSKTIKLHLIKFISESSGQMNADMIRFVTSFIVITCVIISCDDFRDLHLSRNLSTETDALVKIVGECISAADFGQDFIDAILEVLNPSLSHFLSALSTTNSDLISSSAYLWAPVFNEAFENRRRKEESIALDDDLDVIGESESQISQARENANLILPRQELTAKKSISSFRCSTLACLRLVASMKSSNFSLQPYSHVTHSFVDWMTSRPPSEALACWPLLQQICSLGLPFQPEDALPLLEYLGRDILQVYEYERCELSLAFCLEVLKSLAVLWTNPDFEELYQLGSDIYQWFVTVALGRSIVSSRVLVGIASLLHQILKVQPDYARSLSLPSVRTSLFKVLQDGELSVKYHVAERIPELFHFFILKKHEAIFDDVLDSLPSDMDWIEGIGLRLLVLTRLASSWYTLLRRSVYHIVETPGLIPDATGYATTSVRDLSKALGLPYPRNLLRLFKSQLLYTWLENQSLQSLPFIIFGYSDLSGLLNDVQDEIVGQFLMRGKDDQIDELAHELQIPAERLIDASFHKAVAYCVARDISMPPGNGSQSLSGEARIRKRLGNKKFLALIDRDFASILGLLFKTIDQEEQIERAFAKHLGFEASREALHEIKGISSSEEALPANQQPSFKSRYLIDEIDHFCRRSSHDLAKLWTPAIFLHVFRELVDTIHPAFGPLHACSVIRRIRILICMADNSALQDYPLERLLRSLHPFLAMPQCTEDTIGLMQYLIQTGNSYLLQVPKFIAGLSMSVLTTLTQLLASAQATTTQESQHQTTLSKARNFRSWFLNYLESYESSAIAVEGFEKSFKVFLHSLRNTSAKGNALPGSAESDLLKVLLSGSDEPAEGNLLDVSARNLGINFLSEDFQKCLNYQEDIFGSDAAAAANATNVLRTCHWDQVGDGYLLWAARVVGRAFISTGSIHEELLRESQLQNIVGHENGAMRKPNSRFSILKALNDLLASYDRGTVGIAETTLQLIISRLEGAEMVEEVSGALPDMILKALDWDTYQPPRLSWGEPEKQSIKIAAAPNDSMDKNLWIRNLCISLCHASNDDTILGSLFQVLSSTVDISGKLFPYILHLVLLRDTERERKIRGELSEAFNSWFEKAIPQNVPQLKSIIVALLYLRTQPIPNEATKADRELWLEIDYLAATNAAIRCGMNKSALLFAEIFSSCSYPQTSRTSQSQRMVDITDMLTQIFRSIDEPDSFYGIQRESSLRSIMDRAEYERDGGKSLSFRAAHCDSNMRLSRGLQSSDTWGTIRALSSLNMNGLSYALLGAPGIVNTGSEATAHMLSMARKLEQWDIAVPTTQKSEAGLTFRAFQCIDTALDHSAISQCIDSSFLSVMKELTSRDQTVSSLRSWLRTLGVLTEMDEVISAKSLINFEDIQSRMQDRCHWMRSGRFEDVAQIFSCRESLFSLIRRRPLIGSRLHLDQRQQCIVDASSLLESSRMSRIHGALQSSLATTTYLSDLVPQFAENGADISAVVKYEEANVLWDQGEITASIRLLKNLNTYTSVSLENQALHLGKAELLAKLGHRVAEARMERPDEVIDHYLLPAITELKGVTEGEEAGAVFHEFAAFCDQQLQNPDNLEDYERIGRLRQRKEEEILDLESLIKKATSASRDDLRRQRARAKQWFELDDREFKRLRDSRQAFIRQSLENYLLCLSACESFNNDVLRFCALWLDQSESELANKAVSRHLERVPSRKFATLMNQLSSRLLNNESDFQRLLSSLVMRICVDHPYHGMYQIFASTNTKARSSSDEAAVSRNASAIKIATTLKNHTQAGPIWQAISTTNTLYSKLAMEKPAGTPHRANSKLRFSSLSAGRHMNMVVPNQKIPPATMKVDLRADLDYSHLPYIGRFKSEISILTGVSAPKLLAVIASNGRRYRQIVKGSNDDLRQDAIMEQVFEQVNDLLQNNRLTRQRNIHVRTYKVIPLDNKAGIIEFVSNTIPLHDYLMPSHLAHYPRDMKPQLCRKAIADVQTKPSDVRLKVYRQVTERFHPVLRYFFLELFEEPDDWFEKRTAYSRSTAAISILGHVLGLGDRHCHNILLDEVTGEVVHIDLGVAFEQGRVLPIPEVVPFRLTRDIVDGMGVTKTEGVFRRCCEFTLDALRKESYSIMTILDVLRYDPLYNWSVSPRRLRRMQEAPNETPGPGGEDEGGAADRTKKRDEEEGEAHRALTVVAKKLSKSLSVSATVNELIQAATDERNLAVLFCGWAAYA
ncbi:putative phosphotidylinositol kinase Tel1 [Xylona heveae TC161]|uniref:Serine/threonine-protein kinase Tel1 n=1 Tax=Xylona heveae (strain CBS 132557 / TC161) TaxID=1328760 RepID=A0A165JWK7_XYLHT|nr:putative phosphotidylinositol kinase Tel1 [Xylona heveae TC161]KZF26714.1 putative phosphotidylinositol kinase Tel1 [Xylona heveae TC161]